MSSRATFFGVCDYDLSATLSSGQAFRWCERGGAWDGVVAARFVKLLQVAGGIRAETPAPQHDWRWLADYLQVGADYGGIIATFPRDRPMQAALEACRGLRLLRQDPWECLASFICSSTKQIVQIQEIVGLLCQRFGEPVESDGEPRFAFPSAEQIARGTETRLRACKMGFRAPNLLATARRVASGETRLDQLGAMPCAEARSALMELPGVGPKIADCVLLFAYGFQQAFPVDVWVRRALCHLYFRGRHVSVARLTRFAASHFGAWGGYAQQYLFHHARTTSRAAAQRARKP
ncbi:MAG: DNA-3-methyladenine glycosylase 2 [Verrucomicrobia bacterium]|nr:DNA-3-methyladenine glycosylase 2 [Verrucomicrobiota bacterium]